MNYAVFWIIPGIFMLIFVLFGPLSRLNPNESLGTFLERRRKMDEILKMPDGPALLSALEAHLLEKKKLGFGSLSTEEEEFLNFRLKTKDEEDPFQRQAHERRLMAYVRNNERYFS